MYPVLRETAANSGLFTETGESLDLSPTDALVELTLRTHAEGVRFAVLAYDPVGVTTVPYVGPDPTPAVVADVAPVVAEPETVVIPTPPTLTEAVTGPAAQ